VKVAILDHQSKSVRLQRALVELGHEIVFGGADLVLVDHTATHIHHQVIAKAHYEGSRIATYTHGANAFMAWDGIHPLPKEVDAHIAISDGERECMERYGYPNPIYTTGWYWCEQKPYEETDGKKVLFAPIHPLAGNGFLKKERMEANKFAYSRLLAEDIELSVRFIHNLKANGLWPAYGVEFIQGSPDNTVDDIDKADLVVGWGTFAHLAVARGKPTMMFGQDIPLGDGWSEQDWRWSQNWRRYKSFAHFPFEYVGEIIKGNPEEWRGKFIGSDMDIGRFGDILTEISQQ
jgi:hypothetical protein